MQNYTNTVTDRAGNAIAGASVIVTLLVGGGTATIYSDNGTTIQANPMTTDQNGQFSFYAAGGKYNITATSPLLAGAINYPTITLFDPADANAATSVNATDGAGGSLWTTLQGFINKILSSAGASVVGFLQTGGGAVTSTVQSELRQRISATQFGAVPDGATDCMQAVVNAANVAGAWNVRGPTTVRLPYVAGTANVYRIVNIAALELTNVTLDPDPGVQVRYYGGGPTASTSMLQSRAFKAHEESINIDWVQGCPPPHFLSEKTDYLTPADLDLSQRSSLDATTTGTKLLGFPGGALINELTTGRTATTNSVTFTNRTVGGFSVATLPIKPGEEIDVWFDGAVGDLALCVLGRGNRGYSGVMAGTFNSPISKVETVDGVNVQVAANFMLTDHPTYYPINSIWTARLLTWDTLEILCNGVRVELAKIPNGQFREVGFGVFPNVAATSLNVNGWTKRKIKAPQLGGKYLRVTTFGDSITADRADAWPRHMRYWLDTLLGMRVVGVTNYGVSGDNVAGQWASMQLNGINSADYVVIQIGSNDIQAGTTAASYLATLTSMVNFAEAAGARVILGLPPPFYERNVAGAGVGQNTANASTGSPIRAAILRLAADRGLKLVDTLKLTGPVTGHFINPAFGAAYLGADQWNESMVMDNIHPASVMERLLGRAYAEAIAGDWAGGKSKQRAYGLELSETAVDSWAINGWNSGSVKYHINEAGVVQLAGALLIGTGTVSAGVQVMTVPVGLRPYAAVRLPVIQDGNTACMLQVDPSDGSVKLYGGTPGITFVYTDSLRWNLD